VLRSIRQRPRSDISSDCWTMNDPEIAAIDAALKAKGHSRADLGRLLGLDSAQVSRIFSGRRRLQRHEAKSIEDWLGGMPARERGVVLPGPGMVPLYGWVGAASDSRLTLAEQSIRGWVQMHPSQAHVRDAFALEVSDVSMVPRYEPGEIVYVAPNRWPPRGQDCVVVTNNNEGLLKRFVRRDQEQLILHQLNPDRDFELALSAIAAVHTVVGRG
jgi:phage repressor protein C with HTH and peptisase S24 domain